jgi:hypothetical protein
MESNQPLDLGAQFAGPQKMQRHRQFSIAAAHLPLDILQTEAHSGSPFLSSSILQGVV